MNDRREGEEKIVVSESIMLQTAVIGMLTRVEGGTSLTTFIYGGAGVIVVQQIQIVFNIIALYKINVLLYY